MNFVHIPKTAGRSISEALGIEGDHDRASTKAAPRFAFVRNPFARVYSAWQFNHADLPSSEFRVSEGFREFVLKRDFAGTFYLPMTHWLDAPMDFIGRFESLISEFARLCDWLGASHRELPHVHAMGGDWRSAYDDDTREIVSNHYRNDFEEFGYSWQSS